MTYAAKVIADSIADDVRLTTLEIVFPRFILAEFNTHRVLSRNSASSRAIPVERRIAQVRENPFVPESFTKNQRGMQADEVLDAVAAEAAREIWSESARTACDDAQRLAALGTHKQHANRVIEPYAWHTVVMTATELDNFWALRISKNAQPEMFKTAQLMREAFDISTPEPLAVGDWHVPYVGEEDWAAGTASEQLVKLSVARCAAVSFERQTADRPLDALVERHDKMLVDGHMSPFEHQAQVVAPTLPPHITQDSGVYQAPFSPTFIRNPSSDKPLWIYAGHFCGNFRAPWLQYRKMIPNERVYRGT